ncbi:MAG: Stk1 family PASTA domain-containing Ser/Thr kinase [Actinomycetota bacterium]
MSPADPVHTGRQYGGRYQIRRSIASGGMAEVFMAKDALLNRPVALKLMHPEYAGNKSFVERFRREAQAAASLNDPRIVAIYDWGSDNGTYFIVMEYVEGKTLAEIIRTTGPLEISSAVKIAADVCGGLHLAHRKNIVHRDVKPANIALTAGGQTKVMDFGIARAASDGATSVTQTGMVIGTASYFSPEQAQGQTVDARSDVYSVGVVLYEMLTGTVPFQGESPVAVAYKHVTEDPKPPRDLASDLSPELEAVVMKAMAKNPDNRYSSADEMRLDLERILRGERVEAPRLLSSLEQTALIDASMRSRRPESYAESPANPPPQRRRGSSLFGALVLLAFLAALGAGGYWALQSLSPNPAADREVPDVVGQDVVVAQRRVGQSGLSSEVVRRDFHPTVPAGHVISQAPEEGTKVTGDRQVTVELVESRGPEQLDVPELQGLTRQEAEQRLIDAGLTLGNISTQPDDVVEQGRVVAQDPGPASRANKGQQVSLILSSGRELLSVPELIDLDQASAEARIAEAGLSAQPSEGCDPTKDDGLVVGQDPAAGAEVEEGAEVTFALNRTLTVPNVVGQGEAQALAQLTQSGFETVEVDRGGGLGLFNAVVAQSPAPGQQACAGQKVRLTID